MKIRPFPIKKGLWRQILLCALALLCFFGAVWWVNRPAPDEVLTAARKRNFVSAKVLEVLEDQAEPDTWTEGYRLGTQVLKLEILGGPHKGTILTAVNYLNAYFNVDVGVGDRVVVRMELDEDQTPYINSIYSYYRIPAIMGLVLLFFGLLVVLGGKKGVRALIGLLFTLVSLWSLLIPLYLKGIPPIPLTVAIVALTAAVTLLVLTGASRKTLCAILGCIGGVGSAGLLAALTGELIHLSGFNMPEAEDLVLRAGDLGITVRGLLVSGILISALGAVMDVAMSIASASNELVELNPKLQAKQIFRSGMNIGRDAMGTMANTLILAYTGASLNTLILFQIFDLPMIQLLNSDMMVIEIVQGISGSIGILLTVPLVAALSAWLLPLEKRNGKRGRQT